MTQPIDDVLIVGGGVIGMAIADSLVAEGLRVRLVEADVIGAGASGAAAGMLAPISEAQSPDPLFQLGLESLSRFPVLANRLRETTGIDIEFERSGVLHIAQSEAECQQLQARLLDPELRDHLDWMGASELRKSAPGVTAKALGALVCAREAHLRPPVLLRALARSARARGAEIETGLRATGLVREAKRIVGVETTGGRLMAGAVVLAAGPWTLELLRSGGESLGAVGRDAVRPVRGQIIELSGHVPEQREIVWSGGVYFVPKRDGHWIVGATEESVGFDRRVTAGGVALLVERARSVFPVLSDSTFVRAWSGLRPVSADGRPYIGAIPTTPGLFVATGHGRNGVLLAPITAELIRGELLGKGVPEGFGPRDHQGPIESCDS